MKKTSHPIIAVPAVILFAAVLIFVDSIQSRKEAKANQYTQSIYEDSDRVYGVDESKKSVLWSIDKNYFN